MAQKTKIQWATASWNPVRGCTKVSPGCKHCYAESQAKRFAGNPLQPYHGFGFTPRVDPDELPSPLTRLDSQDYFVNSMSDLFHEDVPDEFIVKVCEVMELASWHVFIVLTKRASRLNRLLNGKLRWAAALPNVWWGVSVEDRERVSRIKLLRDTPAAVKFISAEPLLEDLGRLSLAGIDMVIVGGESGPKFRPMEEDWVRSIRDQCAAQDVAFFFKQWATRFKEKSEIKKLPVLDKRTHDERPQRVVSHVPSRSDRGAALKGLLDEIELLRPLVASVSCLPIERRREIQLRKKGAASDK